VTSIAASSNPPGSLRKSRTKPFNLPRVRAFIRAMAAASSDEVFLGESADPGIADVVALEIRFDRRRPRITSRVSETSNGPRSLRAIVSITRLPARAAQPFDDLLDIHPGGWLSVDFDDPSPGSMPAFAAGVPSIGEITSGTFPSRVNSTPMPPELATSYRRHLLILFLIHVIGMWIEPREHAPQSILGQVIARYRRDIIPLDLFHDLLNEAEIVASAGISPRCRLRRCRSRKASR